MQLFLLGDAGLRCLNWSVALVFTIMIGARYGAFEKLDWSKVGQFSVAWDLAQRIVCLVAVYNALYLLVLAAMRATVPTPKPGSYSLVARRPNRNLVYAAMLGLLTKSRYEAPFPGFLVRQFANIAPFRWLLNWKLGPHSQSVFFVEPNILDPSFVKIGKNVTIGFGTTIAAHVQDRKILIIQPTVIEDDVLIGAHVAIPGGVTIKRGAVIRACSSLMPGDVVGENEYWAGFPATKVQDLKPLEIGKRDGGS